MVPGKNGTRSKGHEGRLSTRRISPIPIEWMGPPAWRLPSGKALAEFALQSGFFAPLLIGEGPFWKFPKTRRAGSNENLRREALRDSGNGMHQ